jgi:hypothetical protein
MIELIGNLDVGQHLRRIWLDVTTDFGLHRFIQNGRDFFSCPGAAAASASSNSSN